MNYIIIYQMTDPSIIPEALKSLVGKTYLFLVSIETDNISGGNDIFKVTKVWSCAEMNNFNGSENFTESLLDNSQYHSVDEVCFHYITNSLESVLYEYKSYLNIFLTYVGIAW